MDLASLAGLPATPASHDGVIWGIPFAGLLLSIAILPLILPRFWHHHFGKIALYWTLLLIAALARAQGLEASAAEMWRQMLVEYLPFLALLLALYTAGGGILLEGGPWGTPGGNTLLLAIGTLAAGVLGTTGVSMVLIHPLLRANAHRRRRVHLVVFFVLLCANAGGVTSPLGDPPLYVGFLRGVPFFWPVTHLAGLLAMVALPLLMVFWLIDRRLACGDKTLTRTPLRVTGGGNFALVLVVAAVVLGQGMWHPGQMRVLGAAIDIERLAGMAVLFGVAALLSLAPSVASAQAVAGAQAAADPSLRCAAWAAIQAGQATEDESKNAFTYVLTWFIGRYEGATGKRFDEVLTAGDVEKYGRDMDKLNQLCLPLMLSIGDRMESWGAKMQAPLAGSSSVPKGQ